MKKEHVQYYKDRLISCIGRRITASFGRLRTGMQLVLLELQLKRLFPDKIDAIEIFGMHGLWHTMDYIELVNSLEIFEINKTYHDLSKRNLGKYNVAFYNQDSLQWIRTTSKKYNFIVSDSPHDGPFYDEDGLPVFMDDLLRVAGKGAIIVFNLPSRKLKNYPEIVQRIRSRVGVRRIRDIFFMPRNKLISYGILAVE